MYLPNKTKEQAFRLGYEIAEAVTKRNPVPIKLKFEKVRALITHRADELKPDRYTCHAS